MKGTALVTGPQGLIGSHVCERLVESGEWEVLGASRRGAAAAGVEGVRVDLADAEAARAGLAQSGGSVTHLVFAAYAADPDPLAEAERNVALLANTLAGLRAAGAPLRQVTIFQGAKAYGAHLGPFPTPARESDPRVFGPLFYYPQEDLLRAEAARGGFDFTILRPDFILGSAPNNPINILLSAAVYGAYCAAEGVPFRFPGTPAAFDALLQMTSADLLARATEWAMSAPAAAGEIFNVTNGDHIRWRYEWEHLAAALGLPTAEPQPLRLAAHVAGRPEVWQAIVAAHGLRPTAVTELVSWAVADFMFGIAWDVHSSTVKIRQAGFGECVDTRAEIARLVAHLRSERFIP
jgi:nucleoside-diphosphate-sugar epimerase